jgi:hypothetical protein
MILHHCSGLEPKTVLSQWYPTKDLYPDRNVEGMYLLTSVPFLPALQLNLPPKALVEGCAGAMDALERDILTHYPIIHPDREQWSKWFRTNKPAQMDTAEQYIRRHKYHCPLMSYFRASINAQPNWEPSAPKCSFSIFPSYVVVALPSVQCRFDPHNSFAPYMELVGDATNGDETATANSSA